MAGGSLANRQACFSNCSVHPRLQYARVRHCRVLFLVTRLLSFVSGSNGASRLGLYNSVVHEQP